METQPDNAHICVWGTEAVCVIGWGLVFGVGVDGERGGGGGEGRHNRIVFSCCDDYHAMMQSRYTITA